MTHIEQLRRSVHETQRQLSCAEIILAAEPDSQLAFSNWRSTKERLNELLDELERELEPVCPS